MNRLTHSKNTTILAVLSALTLGCFTLAPQARAVCQEGCLTNQNTVLGDDALINNTTGYSNTAAGSQALKNNTAGVYNTANGYQALLFNTTGASNTANGAQALFLNTTGSDNTASGVSALSGNTTGNNNTASGVGALAFNTTGGQNTANGVSALLSNMTGSYNTANGYGALNLNTAGNSNTANGNRALASNTDGAYNTANGDSALFNNTTGNDNIALGANAGQNLTTGSNNIDIGNLGLAGESGAIRIGTAGTQTATYVAGIYQAAIGSGLAIRVSSSGKLGTMASSARYKEAIKPMDKASEAILALKPITFRYKHELDPEGILQFGLVAEDVEKVNPDLVARDDQGKAYTVRYEAVNAMLLNEFLKEHQTVQELKFTLAKQEATVARQQKQIEALTEGLQKVGAQLEASKPALQVVSDNH